MNILVSKPAQPGERRGHTAGAHQDNTLIVYLPGSPWPAYSHETDVLYLQVRACGCFF